MKGVRVLTELKERITELTIADAEGEGDGGDKMEVDAEENNPGTTFAEFIRVDSNFIHGSHRVVCQYLAFLTGFVDARITPVSGKLVANSLD